MAATHLHPECQPIESPSWQNGGFHRYNRSVLCHHLGLPITHVQGHSAAVYADGEAGALCRVLCGGTAAKKGCLKWETAPGEGRFFCLTKIEKRGLN